jgi:GT2 family glycosyltransferase
VASFNYFVRDGNKKRVVNNPINIYGMLEQYEYNIGLLVHKSLIGFTDIHNDALWKERLLLYIFLKKEKYHHYDIGVGSVSNFRLDASISVTDIYKLYRNVAGSLGYFLEYCELGKNLIQHKGASDSEVVGIVIVSSTVKLLEKCLSSIENTNYLNFHIHVVWYGDEIPVEVYHMHTRYNISIHKRKYDKFNFARVNNEIIKEQCGDYDYVVLMNDDIEVVKRRSWLKNMVYLSKTEKAEIVGSALYFPGTYIRPDKNTGITYQHAGVKLGNNTSLFDHINYKKKVSKNYKSNSEVSAVTFAMVLIAVPLYKQLDGMDEKFYGDCNDIDFCLRAREVGVNIWYCARAEAIHHESITRKKDPAMQNDYSSRDFYNENIERLRKEFTL